MSTDNKLGHRSRDQIVAIVGEEAAIALESVYCEPTGRMGFRGTHNGDEVCEWRAAIRCTMPSGMRYRIEAYYYTYLDEQEQGEVDHYGYWYISGYELVPLPKMLNFV